MKSKSVQLEQVDEKLKPLQDFVGARPREGWIRVIRSTLGLTLKQLAGRLGVSTTRVVRIETDELEGALTIKTLESVAEAMQCKFVYGFVPEESLKAIVHARARLVATEFVKRTHRSMSLEDQATDAHQLEQEIETLVQELLSGNWNRVWDDKIV